MTKKFKALIIDNDIGSPGEGWYRIIEFFKNHGYLSEKKDYTINAPIDSTIDYAVFSSENKKTLKDAFEHLERSQAKYDLFFFDIDLANGGKKSFIGDLEEDYLIGENNSSNLLKDEKSAHLAGLEFINILKQDDRPKIFFSGSDEADAFFKYIEYVKNRFEDVRFTDISKKTSRDIFEEFINNYLQKIQIQVCSQLTYSQQEEILNSLSESNYDVPINVEGFVDDNWTLRTLFPFHINNIERSEENIINNLEFIESVELDYNQNLKEKLTQELKSILSGYPRSFKHLRNVNHIKDENEKKIAICKTHIQFLNKKEYVKKSKLYTGKSLVKFNPISTFLPLEKITLKDEEFIRFIKEIPDKICNIKSFPNISILDIETKNSIRDNLDILISNCGLYPGHLDYIIGILSNNAEKYNQKLKSLKIMNPEHEDNLDDDYKLTFTYVGITRITKDHFSKALINILNTKNDLLLDSEGLQDIFKIIAFSYKGKIKIQNSKIGYNIFYLNKNKIMNEELLNKSDLENNSLFDISFTISFPILKIN